VRSTRGFTLIEVAIAVAVVVLVASGAVAASMSARSLAVSTAATHFDALLDAARTTAREFDGGATIVFERDAYGDGFTAQVYGRRPSTGPLITTDLPSYDGRVTLTETALLGAPAFALALHANGKLGGIVGDVLHGTAAPENACPASGAYVLVFSYGNAKATRTLPCTIDLAATGPIAYLSPSPATPAPTPTVPACAANGCITTPPPSPNVVTTCPPGYIQASATSCVPSATSTPSAGPTQGGTCPPNSTGSFPNCIPGGTPATATPSASSPCVVDANGDCLEDETGFLNSVDCIDAYGNEDPTQNGTVEFEVYSVGHGSVWYAYNANYADQSCEQFGAWYGPSSGGPPSIAPGLQLSTYPNENLPQIISDPSFSWGNFAPFAPAT
jgi:prepilin-type N-terminal cleavage/methylation domain-containing protein